MSCAISHSFSVISSPFRIFAAKSAMNTSLPIVKPISRVKTCSGYFSEVGSVMTSTPFSFSNFSNSACCFIARALSIFSSSYFFCTSLITSSIAINSGGHKMTLRNVSYSVIHFIVSVFWTLAVNGSAPPIRESTLYYSRY